MPTLMNHSHYWQIAPTPAAVTEVLQQYPSWQSTVFSLLFVLFLS